MISKILYKAAKLVENGKCHTCCCAIYHASVKSNSIKPHTVDAAISYLRKFGPSHVSKDDYWYGEIWNKDSVTENMTNRNRRVIALCFAANLAKLEGN